jgi:hypothetical protein
LVAQLLVWALLFVAGSASSVAWAIIPSSTYSVISAKCALLSMFGRPDPWCFWRELLQEQPLAAGAAGLAVLSPFIYALAVTTGNNCVKEGGEDAGAAKAHAE